MFEKRKKKSEETIITINIWYKKYLNIVEGRGDKYFRTILAQACLIIYNRKKCTTKSLWFEFLNVYATKNKLEIQKIL